MLQEVQRYRGWYFGLVTSTVPNPLLWAFQAAIVAGIIALAFRVLGSRAGDRSATADPRGPLRLLILAVGGALIFAGLINNKVPVYMPHLLLGFALAAGFAVSDGRRRIRGAQPRRAGVVVHRGLRRRRCRLLREVVLERPEKRAGALPSDDRHAAGARARGTEVSLRVASVLDAVSRRARHDVLLVCGRAADRFRIDGRRWPAQAATGRSSSSSTNTNGCPS